VSDRTEAPTPRRLRRAREEGDSGASSFAGQAAAFVVAVALALPLGKAVASQIGTALSPALTRAVRPGGPLPFDSAGATWAVLRLVLPMLVVASAVAIVAQGAQTGGMLTTRRLAPDLRRLDPIQGMRSLFSYARFWALGRALAAGAVVGCLASEVLTAHALDLARTAGRLSAAGLLAGALARSLAWRVAIVGLAFAVVDVLVVRRAWMNRLKMTHAEVRREHRESEGDPQLKAARARAHRELLAQAVIAGVRDATVVVVNPTHLACALRYAEKDGDEAPVVVAAGEGDLAARIVQAAREAGVPVVRDVPLARALVELEVGSAIPEALYQAVAEVLREVWEEEQAAGPERRA
jgi:flagellar biosynthesis protein FlhB